MISSSSYLLVLIVNMLCKKLIDEDNQVRKNTAMALMKLEAYNSVESIEIAKSAETDESVQAVFNVAINILSRDS